MKKTILELLLQIPPDAVTAMVDGVSMQIISEADYQKNLSEDPGNERFHACMLANGMFMFESRNGRLISLYKVAPEI